MIMYKVIVCRVTDVQTGQTNHLGKERKLKKNADGNILRGYSI